MDIAGEQEMPCCSERRRLTEIILSCMKQNKLRYNISDLCIFSCFLLVCCIALLCLVRRGADSVCFGDASMDLFFTV